MSAETFVLDTSALMAFIEKEEGAERVRAVIQSGNIILSWVSILEIIYITRREIGESEAMARYAMLKDLKANILWNADEPLLLTAARLKADHRLSFADSIIAAIAIQQNAILLHKDPEYETLQGQLKMEALPYK